MYVLMNLNRCSDALAGEFINVDHMFYFNPLPRSGTLCTLCLCGEIPDLSFVIIPLIVLVIRLETLTVSIKNNTENFLLP